MCDCLSPGWCLEGLWVEGHHCSHLTCPLKPAGPVNGEGWGRFDLNQTCTIYLSNARKHLINVNLTIKFFKGHNTSPSERLFLRVGQPWHLSEDGSEQKSEGKRQLSGLALPNMVFLSLAEWNSPNLSLQDGAWLWGQSVRSALQPKGVVFGVCSLIVRGEVNETPLVICPF